MPPRRRRSRRGGSRQEVTWYDDFIAPVSIATLAVQFIDLLPLATMPLGYQAGFTILRFIAEVVIHTPAVAPATPLGSVWAAYVAPRSGIASGPNPDTELVDSYWKQRSAAVPQTPEAAPQRYVVDLRTARKIRGEGRTLVFAMSNTALESYQWSMNYRALLGRS